MAITKNALRVLKCIVYTLWPMTAVATQVTLGDTLLAVPNLAWLMVFILSTVSGLAAVLNALKGAIPARWVIFVSAHMSGSWLAGLLVFLAVESSNVPDLLEAVLIGLGSYAGAKLMDKWSDTVLSRLPKGE